MNALLGMAYKLRNAANRNTRLDVDVALLCEYALAAADTMEAEHSRLIEGLRLIECEPLNAEYMARNILDGLPAYHDTMLKCGEGCKCKVGAGKTALEVHGTVFFKDNHQYRSQLRFPIADGAYELVKIENPDMTHPLFHVAGELFEVVPDSDDAAAMPPNAEVSGAGTASAGLPG